MEADFQSQTYALQLREFIAEGSAPPSYESHPVVQRNAGRLVAPLGVYMDALPYSLVDSVLGVWVINLVTGARHVLLTIRKKRVCSCGCKGWCTYYVILLWIRWCIECMASGVFPERRHDSTPFTDMHDELRAAVAGSALSMASAVLKLKGDWSEFCERFGFPNWRSGMRPCFCCNGFGPELYSPVGVSLTSCPWHLNTDEDYERACAYCEIWVTVSREDHQRMLAVLHWDKRKDGARGRSLTVDLASFGLKKDDRLEPHPNLIDVAQFDHISDFPCRVLFWRRSRETICTHRCPIFSRYLGVTQQCIAIDILHTLLLGPFLVWGRIAVWKLLLSGVWGALEENNEARLKIAVTVLRTALHSWYRAEPSAGRFQSRIDVMTAKMIGTAGSPTLKLKAMEAFGFVQFLVHSLQTYQVRGSEDLVAAGNIMVQLVELMKVSPARLSAETTKQMLSLWKQHMAIMEIHEPFVPKHHLMFHCIMRSVFHGNPWLDATFLDESLNKELKQCCRYAHQTTFESTVILKINLVLKRMQVKRRMRSRPA